MKIVVPVDPDIVNSKLVALNIDNQPLWISREKFMEAPRRN